MHDNLAEIQAIRDRQLTWGFRAIALIGFFALIISLSRAFDVGWQNIMALHMGLYLVVVAIVILDKHLSFSVRAWVLIGIVFIKGVAGLISWGLTGFGTTALVVCCFLCTIGFGMRAGIISTIVSILCAGLIGAAFHLHHLSLQFDPSLYLNSLSAWAAAIVSIILSAGLIVIALGTMNKQFFMLAKILDQRNCELLRTNRKLEEEIQERERLSQERMALQTKLQRAQKMEVVANVAGGVAHDLNNVLAGAVSYPDLLCTQLPPDSPLRNTLEKIKKSGLKAAAIVSDLLTLVRRGIVTKKITNMNLLISEYLNSPEYERLRSYHPEVAVEPFLDEALWNISGSPVHIMKAIMNLVSNGVEAISGDGKLTIMTRNINIRQPFVGYDDEITPGEYVVLEVADTGSGMSPEELERVFEPFYSKKVLGKSGTGLGMTVVWGAVKDHEGHIDIQSTRGKGTSFRIYFPASQERAVDTDTDLPLEEYKGNGESILVIDDVVEQRDVAVALLTTLGYTAIALPNGEEAVRYLQNNSVDLVVLDMIMDPGMDGLDTYREIVKLYPSQKAIIATGYCETERVKEAQKLGTGNCLLKPFTLEKLGKTVRSELEIKRLM
jgi:two-component system cell cycle sensor histidine kinase/response regulator CckA